MMRIPFSYFGTMLANVLPMRHVRASISPGSGKAQRGRSRYRPSLEILEDRSMPSLIATQILPGMFPNLPTNRATTSTVTVLAPALTAESPTPQQITLTSTISGAPTGGTVNFTIAGAGTLNNVPVVNGVAQGVFTIPVGTLASAGGTVTATYTGTTGFAGSTSRGGGNGTLTFCADDNSTLLGSTLQTYAVLAGSNITNVGNTVIIGNVGVSPGTSVTGFPPGMVLAPSTIHINDGPGVGTAGQAQIELTTAYNTILNATTGFTDLTGQDLGGLILTPGRYHFDNSAQLTGTLILDNQNVPDARYDFQIGSTLTTASASRILFINGGADNVYWQVGTSAIIGSSTVFAGNILANASISLDATASIACGRALARVGGVTLINNFIDPAPTDTAMGHFATPTIVAGSSAGAAANALNFTLPAMTPTPVVAGTKALLRARGSDSTGTALRYTWSTVRTPATFGLRPPTFSINATSTARDTTVTFRAAGSYTFRVTITNRSGQSTSSDVVVVVKQTLTRIKVTPATSTIGAGQVQTMSAQAFDQFGAAMSTQPVFVWSMARGSGSISSTGVYTPAVGRFGTMLIRARFGLVSGIAAVSVVR